MRGSILRCPVTITLVPVVRRHAFISSAKSANATQSKKVADDSHFLVLGSYTSSLHATVKLRYETPVPDVAYLGGRVSLPLTVSMLRSLANSRKPLFWWERSGRGKSPDKHDSTTDESQLLRSSLPVSSSHIRQGRPFQSRHTCRYHHLEGRSRPVDGLRLGSP